ncbi:hypothetical protein DXG01_016732 [Tephrocybe rancida]|nr:hypothetical protein DXG01_016732 [Tephrocybe rancida]
MTNRPAGGSINTHLTGLVKGLVSKECSVHDLPFVQLHCPAPAKRLSSRPEQHDMKQVTNDGCHRKFSDVGVRDSFERVVAVITDSLNAVSSEDIRSSSTEKREETLLDHSAVQNFEPLCQTSLDRLRIDERAFRRWLHDSARRTTKETSDPETLNRPARTTGGRLALKAPSINFGFSHFSAADTLRSSNQIGASDQLASLLAFLFIVHPESTPLTAYS